MIAILTLFIIMADTTNIHPDICPFCHNKFKRVGRHLKHCKERLGREYSHYLAENTLTKRTRSTKQKCGKCHRFFVRLDTHLRTSARCRYIKDQERLEPSTVTAEPMPSPSDISVNNTRVPPRVPPQSHSPPLLHLLKLPTDVEQWRDANEFISAEVALCATSPEQKYLTLVQGLFLL